MQPARSRKQVQYIRQADHAAQPARHVLARQCGSGDGGCGAERLEGRTGLWEGGGEVGGVGDGRVGDGDGGYVGAGGVAGAGAWGCGGGGGGGGGWGGGFDYPHSGKGLVCGF